MPTSKRKAAPRPKGKARASAKPKSKPRASSRPKGKSRTAPKPSPVNTGGGAYINGPVNVKGNFAGRDQYNLIQVEKMFKPVYDAIAARSDLPAPARDDLKAETQDVEAEVKKGDQADESALARHLRNIKNMAPDILEVILSAASGPGAVLNTAVKKIMEKVKAEPA
jgi:hypothetical protein